jgi:hypothetical protein
MPRGHASSVAVAVADAVAVAVADAVAVAVALGVAVAVAVAVGVAVGVDVEGSSGGVGWVDRTAPVMRVVLVAVSAAGA